MTEKTNIDDIIGIVKTEEKIDSVELKKEYYKSRMTENKRFKYRIRKETTQYEIYDNLKTGEYPFIEPFFYEHSAKKMCEFLNRQEEEIQELKQRNQRQYDRLKELTELMYERQWEKLENMVEEWEKQEELLQAEWGTYCEDK